MLGVPTATGGAMSPKPVIRIESNRTTSVVVSRALIVMVIIGLVTTGLARTTEAMTGEESSLLTLANAERRSAGLAEFSYDATASNIARAWSGQMATLNLLQHNPYLAQQITQQVTASWQRLGENVGVGYSVSSVHSAFMSSSAHRANVLGDYNRVGVGVVKDRSGRIWVTFVFIKATALATSDAVGRPWGTLEQVRPLADGIFVRGWTLDPDTPTSTYVWIDISGHGFPLGSSLRRDDVGAAYPGYGPYHGYQAAVPTSHGFHRVCATAVNLGPGIDTPLGCQTVLVGAVPFGRLDNAVAVPGGIFLNGWALDPDTTSSIYVWIDVNGRGFPLGTPFSRPDIADIYRGYGPYHGFQVAIPAAAGTHWVCATAIDAEGGPDNPIGCRSVTVR